MSKNLRNLGLAALLAVSASAFMSTSASALSMAECSAMYKNEKATNGPDAGMKWNDFRKAHCAANAAAPAAPMTKAAKTVAPAAPAAKVAAPAAPAAAAATPSGSFMKDCAAAWKGLKASNGVPAGMTWKDFVAAKCVVAGAPAAAPAAPVAAPAKMTKTSVAPPEPPATADTTPEATADKNGKPYTPGQLAAHKRIKECGVQWRGLKAANKVPAGTSWPQYWSACNKQLKAQGQ